MAINSILIIEDESNLRSEVVDMLMYEGFTVYEAENGHEGVKLAIEFLPDLILCDIMMPEMGGLEVLQRIRGLPETMLTPFIFTTALAERSHLRKGMENGADDYITKPFTIKELLKAIEAREAKEVLMQEKISLALETLKHSLDNRLKGLSDQLLNSDSELAQLHQKTELLEEKLVFQDLEATTEAIRVIEANNTISNLMKMVEKELKRSNLRTSEEKLLIQLRNEIRNPQLLSTNRSLFQLKFNQTNPLFLDFLLKKFPSLTKLELTLCSALILNIDNHQLSVMLNIDASSVRKSKYRLKKKLKLNTEDNLVVFLHQLNHEVQMNF
ncbi:response regulator transcription factor [Mariniphaga sediminis]|uniref:response regulator transcription factor n=1 Tax=Mariniphaga sediminis TaxID=1628158 RepID=UPI0035617CF8